MSILTITVPLGTPNLEQLRQKVQNLVPGAVEALFCSDIRGAEIRTEVNESANRAPLVSMLVSDLSSVELDNLMVAVSAELCLTVALAEEFVPTYDSAAVLVLDDSSPIRMAEWPNQKGSYAQSDPFIPTHPSTILSLLRIVRPGHPGAEGPLAYLRDSIRAVGAQMKERQAR